MSKHSIKDEIPNSDASSIERQNGISPSPIDLENKIQNEEATATGGVFEKVLSRTRSRSSYIDPGPPPDGGLEAWTQSLCGHLIVANTWGYVSSFGVFQTYYVSALGHPPSDISWVGSVQIFLLFFIGTFSGRATDYGLFKPTLILGSFFMLLGVFMTSVSTKYWQLFLAQGICTGIGNGLIFCPAVSILSTYFTTKRSLAIGFAAAGSATGGLIFPAIAEQLLYRIGFPWTVRVIGFVMLAMQAVAVTFANQRLPPRKSGPLVEWPAFKELSYTLFAIGMFLNFFGLYFAFYYVGSFARNILGLSQQESINDLLVINGVGMIGRLVPAYLADRYFGPLNLLIPFACISGVLLFCWAAVSNTGGLLAFDVIYGLFASGIQSLFPATLSSLTTDLKKAGVRMGMVFSVVSFACLTGPPLGGALIEKRGGGYLYAQMFAASALTCGSLTLLAARFVKTGPRFKARV